MSVIRHRRRNMILSGLMGLIIGVMAMTATAYGFRYKAAEVLNLGHTVIEEAPIAQLVPLMVAARPIAQGAIIEIEDIKEIDVGVETSVTRDFATAEEIIGQMAVLDIDINLPLTRPMFFQSTVAHQQDRIFEMGFVELPYNLSERDVIDVRIAFPTGQEYVVLSKKQVVAYHRQSDNIHEGLLSLAINEKEALSMSSALVDKFLIEGTRIYTVKYVMPEVQERATADYPVNPYVQTLLKTSPNIKDLKDLENSLAERQALDKALSETAHLDLFEGIDMSTPAMAARTEGLVNPVAAELGDKKPEAMNQEEGLEGLNEAVPTTTEVQRPTVSKPAPHNNEVAPVTPAPGIGF